MHALDAPRARILHDAAPEPTRWPPGFGPHGSTSPRTPRLAASRQTTLARYSAAARAFLAALRRRQCASATGSAAQASPARHLAPGAVRAHPQGCRLALVAATFPCSYRTAVRRPPYPPPRNRPCRAIKGTPSPSEHARNLKLPPWNPHSPQSSGKRRLLHLRQLLPPPLSRSLRSHQGFSLRFLFTKNTSFLPGTQPPT